MESSSLASTNGNDGKKVSSSFQDALDRMAAMGGGALAAAAATSATGEFIPSSTWKGRKEGYYFGTSDKAQGTGYYLDNNTFDSKKKRKRSVQIAEDQNELRIIEPVSLLEQAETRAKGSSSIVIELTPKGLRGATNSLAKIVTQNAMQRAEFSNDPEQYMASELALYEHIISLQAIAANLDLYQHLLLENESSSLLVTLTQLLGHENVDVCASVIALFLEWVDPSLLSDDDNNNEQDLLPILSQLAKTILQDAWETMVANLARFQQQQSLSSSSPAAGGGEQDEAEDQNLKGVDNVLSLMENILEFDLLTPGGLLGESHNLSAAAHMVQETKIASWLFLQLVDDDDDDNTTSSSEESKEEFQARCLELLALLTQQEDVHRILPDWSQLPPYTSAFVEEDETNGAASQKKKSKPKSKPINGIELLLQSIGKFRKVQPANDTQVEYLENACIALSACVTFSSQNLATFLEGQGIELVLRCLKERAHAGGSGLKLLDFFGSQAVHKQACEHLVKAGGLKYLCPLFMGTRIPKPAAPLFQATSKKGKREWLHLVETQSIRILHALTRHLDDSSPHDAKSRMISKFLHGDGGDDGGNDGDKCDRLVELLLSYDQKARKAEYNFYRFSVDEDDDLDETMIQLAALEAKLKGGGEIFHRLGTIAACLCVNSKRCHQRILSQLQLQQSGISVIKAALEEFVSVLGSGEQKEQLELYLTQI
jgi:beta-catenin-like protein 1